MDAFWIIGTGFLVSLSCGLLGVFLILRKISMIGDAISHAVLPGIVMAVFLTNRLDSAWVFIGAGLSGLAFVVLMDLIRKRSGIQSDASMGTVFTVFFALGVLMISFYGGNVHIDQECVLYGEITFLPLSESLTFLGRSIGPGRFWILLINTVLVILFIWVLFKELQITSFDGTSSILLGLSPIIIQYLLLGMVSFTTVASFEAVGSILVVAFLVANPLAAFQWTDKLKVMLGLTIFFGLVSSIGGYYLALTINNSISASMVVISGLIFALSFSFQRFKLLAEKNSQTQ